MPYHTCSCASWQQQQQQQKQHAMPCGMLLAGLFRVIEVPLRQPPMMKLGNVSICKTQALKKQTYSLVGEAARPTTCPIQEGVPESATSIDTLQGPSSVEQRGLLLGDGR